MHNQHTTAKCIVGAHVIEDSLCSHLSEFLLEPSFDGLEILNPLLGRGKLLLKVSYLGLKFPLLFLKVSATLWQERREGKNEYPFQVSH